MRRDSDRDVLRSPDPAVLELEISWASAEWEEPEWKEKELQEDDEELKNEKDQMARWRSRSESQHHRPDPVFFVIFRILPCVGYV